MHGCMIYLFNSFYAFLYTCSHWSVFKFLFPFSTELHARVFPCASSLSETVPPPPKALLRIKFNALMFGISYLSTSAVTNSFKVFFYSFCSKIFFNDFVTIIIVGNYADICCISFITASAVCNISKFIFYSFQFQYFYFRF